jgi:single-strand DNA-binding protein
MVERFVRKGKMVGVSGKITTGKYEKDGQTIYTTEVTANRIHIIEWPDKGESNIPEGFATLDDDEEIPF